MNYRHYFSLQLFHDFYADRICADFSIEPTTSCQRLLRGHRLIFKSSTNGFVAIAPIDEAQHPDIPLAENLSFSFFLRLKNSDFINFTALDLGEQAIDRLLYFSNLDLQPDASSDPQPLDLPHTTIQRSDLRKPEAERSALETHLSQMLEREIPNSRGIFGIVEIYNNQTLPQVLESPTPFNIQFAAQQKYWRYYLIAEASAQAQSFSIQDKAKQIAFEAREPEERDRILAAIQSQFPQSQTYVFQSTAPVPCKARGIADIQLMKNGEKKPWIQHLPNPPNHSGTQAINLLTDV